ncbi:MAG: sigma factor-like helix-turn-helix DNA-binding protein [Acidimicrobiia bacterium]
MSSYLWPSEDGWPYPDAEAEVPDLSAGVDDDALLLRMTPAHLFDTLEPLERQVITAHYGLNGAAPRSMKELHNDLGLSRAEVREALAGGLAKLRTTLST